MQNKFYIVLNYFPQKRGNNKYAKINFNLVFHEQLKFIKFKF